MCRTGGVYPVTLILLYNKKVLIQMIMIVILIKTVVFKLLDIIGFGNVINLEQESAKIINDRFCVKFYHTKTDSKTVPHC